MLILLSNLKKVVTFPSRLPLNYSILTSVHLLDLLQVKLIHSPFSSTLQTE